MSSVKLSDFIDELQAKGRYSFTLNDLAEVDTHRSIVATQAALQRLRKNRRIVSPRRGFFVILRPEYRKLGSPPASWFIDDLMRYLEQPYYVALLSAAALHGAAHQQPMIFQVMTDRPTRTITIGSVTISFHMARNVTKIPTKKVQTETGYIIVATPETTAFDIVRYPEAAGHLNNVATVLSELSEKIDASKLASLASLYSVPDVQRLGFLLENIVDAKDRTYLLLEHYRELRRRPILLNPDKSAKKMTPDKKWCVIPNDSVEPDV
jgi:predicted transcriptional regulator of viral defense system